HRVAIGSEFRTVARTGRGASEGYAGICKTPSPDGRMVAMWGGGGGVFVEVPSGRPLGSLPDPRDIPLRFEPSGALLTWGPDGLLRWPIACDAAAPNVLRVEQAQPLIEEPIYDVPGCSADGNVVAIGRFNNGVEVIRRDRGNSRLKLEQKDVRACAVSP